MFKPVTALLALAAFIGACQQTNPDPIDEPGKPINVETPAFARGADVSWLSEMENDKKTFKRPTAPPPTSLLC